MSNRLVSPEAIEALREAARGRDWNQCDAALGQALAGLSPDVLLALTEAVLRDRLPTFERNNPGEPWPRRGLDGLETGLGPDDHPGPGGNSFGSGVEDLVEARTRTHEPEAFHRLILSALSESVMAEMCAVWGEDHPEAWKLSHELTADGQAVGCSDPMWGWSRDPKVIQTERRGWNDLADRLEALEGPAGTRDQEG